MQSTSENARVYIHQFLELRLGKYSTNNQYRFTRGEKEYRESMHVFVDVEFIKR